MSFSDEADILDNHSLYLTRHHHFDGDFAIFGHSSTIINSDINSEKSMIISSSSMMMDSMQIGGSGFQ